MKSLNFSFVEIGSLVLPERILEPFAVLLDADDMEWRDPLWIQKSVLNLLNKGCRYFVCFGRKSESVHDSIDDVIIDHDVSNVLTTFHSDESRSETADFFKNVVMDEMAQGVILVRNQMEWAGLF